MAKKNNKTRYETNKHLSADTALIAAGNMLLDAGAMAYDIKDTATLIETADRFISLATLVFGIENSIIASVDTDGLSDEEGPDNAKVKGKHGIGFKPTH